MERILVIDDEQEIVELISKGLKDAGYKVCAAFNGLDGLELMKEKELELIILDIMMPKINGIDVCKRIRTFSNIPIIMVSAKGQEQDRIKGLTEGADDYIVKPFSIPELLARVNSQIRRYRYLNQELPNKSLIEAKGISIDVKKHEVSLYGDVIKLTPTEYEILLLLIKNKGQIFSSEEIYKKLWEEKYFDGNNTVMAHIWRLREKIEANPKEPKIIETIWGVGYRIDE